MYEIRVSSRALINWLLLEYLRLEHVQAIALMRVIDRMHKISEKEFIDHANVILYESQREGDLLQRLLQLLKVKKIAELPLVTQQHPAVAELNRLINLLQDNGVSNVMFDLSLMRGFDYYTNIIFEVFDTHPDNNRSMFGGGRYDGLVGAFGVDPVPTVGFGMGDVTLQNFLLAHKLLPKINTETDVVAVLIGDIYPRVQKVLKTMRDEGVRVAVDATDRKVDAKIKNAVKAGIPFALFIGEDELSSQRFKLRDLNSGEDHEHSLERIISILDARHRPLDDL
jgi:histidyl-tRNA synthetase